jgi:hypothetical protein
MIPVSMFKSSCRKTTRQEVTLMYRALKQEKPDNPELKSIIIYFIFRVLYAKYPRDLVSFQRFAVKTANPNRTYFPERVLNQKQK